MAGLVSVFTGYHRTAQESTSVITILVLFQPRQIGACNATLLIEGDMDSPVTVVPLTGEGIYDGSVPLIETHEKDALARVMYQFRDATKFKAALRVIAERTQALEKTLYKLFSLLDLDAATGETLDSIGVILETYRGGGEEDDDYRQRLRAAIVAANSMGSLADVAAACKAFLGDEAEVVAIVELYPAAIEIYLPYGLSYDWDKMRETIENTLPAGVRLDGIIPVATDAFGFSEDETALGFDAGYLMNYYSYR